MLCFPRRAPALASAWRRACFAARQVSAPVGPRHWRHAAIASPLSPPATRRRRPAALACSLLVVLLAAGCGEFPFGEPRLVSGDGSIDWARYYTHAETNRIMRELEAMYPELARMRVIGQSYLGADLTLMEVTNTRTGPAHEKPAMYLDGGLHAQEFTSSAVALYVLAYLLNNYGSEPQVTELLDTRTFYIRPKFNPDGSDLALIEDQWLRSTVRPVDNNDDGIPDSDPPEDLDGDGRILQMRVPDPDGNMRMSQRDPRVMHRRQSGDEGPFFRLIREGIDRNNDGRINSDGIGGLDMNRNFPRNWERQHIQSGAGDFPLSEPETYATARFINEHRNITSIVHGHTSGAFVYRLPSAMDPADMPEADEALVVHLGEFYTRDTGRRVRPSATPGGASRYGTLMSWGYWDHGVIGWVPEYSPPPSQWVPDGDGDGRITEYDWHAYNDSAFGGKYFTDWRPFDHPQLGPIEIGGWHTKFWGQNPPEELLERELEIQVPWILYLAGQSPLLELETPRVTALGGDRFRIEVTVANTGFLPTHLTERGYTGRRVGDRMRHQVVRPPLVVLELEGCTIEDGNGRVRIDHLAGTNPFLGSVVDEPSRVVRFTVRCKDADAAFQIRVESDKGGTVRSERMLVVRSARE